ncbi:hypothetical protein [Microbispora sp. KK1-11]|uniref:hypothetical protein n=1 Tax=Microbispora sp. KK1-11 TaxID=2053005 RepID=UPI00163B661A|nr:hypothetical protein [Microbispora sp. KK1-11]
MESEFLAVVSDYDDDQLEKFVDFVRRLDARTHQAMSGARDLPHTTGCPFRYVHHP